jgi:hypothetical protein
MAETVLAGDHRKVDSKHCNRLNIALFRWLPIPPLWEVYMKKVIAALFLPIVCFLVALVLTQSCGNNESQSTSQYGFYFGDINWPEKYVDDQAKSGWLEYSATVVSGQGAYCWSSIAWRPTWSSQAVAPYDTQTYMVSSGTSEYWFSHPYSSSKQILGVYTITIGLTPFDSNLGNEAVAVETRHFNQYVGATFYEHDVDFDYIYQSDGIDDYDIFSDNSLSDMADPYRDTRVNFVKHDLRATPPPPEDVRYTTADLRSYRDRFASTWPSDPAQYQCHYELISIRHFLTRDGRSISPNVGLAAKGGDNEVACVAEETVDDEFGMYKSSIKMWAAAHELGHVIGIGLSDYCNHSEEHSSALCMMAFVSHDLQGNPLWACDGQEIDDFTGQFEFCSICLQHLMNVEFLVADYSLARGESGQSTNTKSVRSQP